VTRKYEWALHAEAVEVFQSFRQRKRARMIRIFEALAAHPFAEPKTRIRDAEGGEVSVSWPRTSSFRITSITPPASCTFSESM
jgi:hypothetical protein